MSTNICTTFHCSWVSCWAWSANNMVSPAFTGLDGSKHLRLFLYVEEWWGAWASSGRVSQGPTLLQLQKKTSQGTVLCSPLRTKTAVFLTALTSPRPPLWLLCCWMRLATALETSLFWHRGERALHRHSLTARLSLTANIINHRENRIKRLNYADNEMNLRVALSLFSISSVEFTPCVRLDRLSDSRPTHAGAKGLQWYELSKAGKVSIQAQILLPSSSLVTFVLIFKPNTLLTSEQTRRKRLWLLLKHWIEQVTSVLHQVTMSHIFHHPNSSFHWIPNIPEHP